MAFPYVPCSFFPFPALFWIGYFSISFYEPHWLIISKTCFNVKQIASPGSINETRCLGPVHWDDPEGWDEEGSGRGVHDGGHPWRIHVNVWQKPLHYCKVISLQLK